jgi:hypothetical protein
MKTRNKALCRHATLAGLWLIGFPMITPMAQVPTPTGNSTSQIHRSAQIPGPQKCLHLAGIAGFCFSFDSLTLW